MFYTKNEVLDELFLLKNNVEFQRIIANIKSGRFIRDPQLQDYVDRVDYTKELRKYIYNPALLNTIFGDQELNELFFRTFGYRGNLNFTVYPNLWMRDLPLLNFGENVYLGDGILLGTNQVSVDQKSITVGTISIGDRTICDQQVAMGYDTEIGKDCVIGFGVAMGIKTTIGDRVAIGEKSHLGHGVIIGDDVKIAQSCTIGNLCVFEDGASLDYDVSIPAYSIVTRTGIHNRRTGEAIIPNAEISINS